jgi:hypothetical protein
MGGYAMRKHAREPCTHSCTFRTSRFQIFMPAEKYTLQPSELKAKAATASLDRCLTFPTLLLNLKSVTINMPSSPPEKSRLCSGATSQHNTASLCPLIEACNSESGVPDAI